MASFRRSGWRRKSPQQRVSVPALLPSQPREMRVEGRHWAPAAQSERVLRGTSWVVDGDTIIIDRVSIRLAGIDAPELDHPFGQQSKWALVQLCKGQVVTARIKPEMSYDRVVAQCFLPDGRDLAAEMVRLGMALDWPKFSGGRYRHLEPPGARKKLWRANLRQGGMMGALEKLERQPAPPRAKTHWWLHAALAIGLIVLAIAWLLG